MPVMYLRNKDKQLFLNMHEFVYTLGFFEAFLLSENDEEEVVVETSNIGAYEQNSKINRSGIGGQPSIVSKLPEMIDEVAKFIKQHGFAVQSCHRTEMGYSSGVTIKQIRDHVYSKFLQIKTRKITLITIHRML